jgi:TIR domain
VEHSSSSARLAKTGVPSSASIDDGLRRSRYGVVILSPDFFRKGWPKEELDGLVTRQTSEGRKVILPVWHNVKGRRCWVLVDPGWQNGRNNSRRPGRRCGRAHPGS